MTFKRITFLPFLFASFNAFSAPSGNNIQLGIYTSTITYTEPSVMIEKGSLTGFVGRVLSHEDGSFREIEATYSNGYMDYEGSGTINDIPNEMFEIRGLIGHDLRFNANYQITPYIGLGYRYLNDNSSGMISSTSAHGYEREQVYYYSPIGINFKKNKLISGWILSGRVEFDYFIKGKNHSYTGVVSGYDDLSFNQHEGYGNRISFSISRPLSTGTSITIEPFYRHWNISKSDVAIDSKNVGWVEPYNHSKEIGISLLLTI